jgi:hypothetical protein
VSEGEAPTIALLVEAEADAKTASGLVDRVLAEAAHWIADGDPEHYRRWHTIHWKNVRRLCEEHGVVLHGGFGEAARKPDARAARRALMLLAKLGPPEAVVMLRDADDQPARLEGLRQGRDDHRQPLAASRIAVGVADPTREAWHLAGFEAATTVETKALSEERQRLGFDPTRHPHRLRRRGERSIKPVLEALTGGDRDREQRCLECAHDRLEQTGVECGLTDFLAEVRERVVPCFV